MNVLARLSAVAALSIVIVWALSYLPNIRDASQQDRHEQSVFQNLKPIALTNHNLVDFVLLLPSTLKLDRVDWSHNILAFDYELTQGELKRSLVFSQMADCVYQTFAGTTNVERVQIRVFEKSGNPSGGKQMLLVALDAERLQLRSEELEWGQQSKNTAEQWLGEHFKLTRTLRWKQLINER